MKRWLLLALFVAATAQALPLPDSARQGVQGWRQWGSGEMRWFGFSLYRATLWVAGASPESSPSALQLEYRRDIPRERLVQTSLDEMRRLGADEAQLKRWEADLRRVFPEVKEGESIVGVHYPGRGASFYHQGLATGDVADAEFARNFFAIWLDPASRSPALRAALLKGAEG
ncbi:MAG: chalcone isomerase family protein [Betaproteobacteria bacterium]